MDETRRTRPRCWDLHVDQWQARIGGHTTERRLVPGDEWLSAGPTGPVCVFVSRDPRSVLWDGVPRFCSFVPGTGSTSVGRLVRFIISLQLHNVRNVVRFFQEAVKSSSPLNSSGTGSASCACAISKFSMGPTKFTHWEIYIHSGSQLAWFLS